MFRKIVMEEERGYEERKISSRMTGRRVATGNKSGPSLQKNVDLRRSSPVRYPGALLPGSLSLL